MAGFDPSLKHPAYQAIQQSHVVKYIWVYEINQDMNTGNVHRESRNWFRYETFIYLFEFNFFFLIWGKRETQFLSMLTFPSEPAMCGTFLRPQLISPRRVPKMDLLVRSLNLNKLSFFFKFQNPQLFRTWRHSRPRSYFLSGFFIVTSLIVTSKPHAREHLHSMCAPN